MAFGVLETVLMIAGEPPMVRRTQRPQASELEVPRVHALERLA
jgi:hypothetical protein